MALSYGSILRRGPSGFSAAERSRAEPSGGMTVQRLDSLLQQNKHLTQVLLGYSLSDCSLHFQGCQKLKNR